MCGVYLWTRKDAADWLALLNPVKPKLINIGRSVGMIGLGDRLAGSGFVIDSGMVITNAHVLRSIGEYDHAKKQWQLKSNANVTFDAERSLGDGSNCIAGNTGRSDLGPRR
jgi:S1-C subfamily serine protease